ncbi:hypothetical protein [Vibrio agarivorans]|uniref:hypothetical protein n=1 Tax=Vibrio agarivorans TaxID=153622 RepID=UPI0025B54C08|nr:hypothetical protein [Vibrio agarivorans]MDN3661103.1 hypothetical protein [Vibrio agarivorans]
MEYASAQRTVTEINEQSIQVPTDDLSDLMSNPKYQYSAMMHRMVVGKSHAEVISTLHLPVDKDTELNALLKADYVSDEDKLQINAALLNFPYLHDTTHCSLESDLYGNVVLFELLEDNLLALVRINEALCLLIGSQKGLEYVTENRSNKHCPINQYFSFHDTLPKYFTAMGKHIREMLTAPNENTGNKIFNLNNQGVLTDFFEKAASEDMLGFTVRINNRTNKVESVKSLYSRNEVLLMLSESLTDDNLAYTFNTMAQVSVSASEQGQPMVYLRAKRSLGVAYKASRVELNNQMTILEFELFPLIDDKSGKSVPSITESNISKLLSSVDSAISKREPLLICTPNALPPKLVYITILRHIMNQDEVHGSYVCNYEQTMYHGDSLLSLELDMHHLDNILNLSLPFVLTGEVRTKEQLNYINALNENLVPFIALTSTSPKALPAHIQPYILQLN